MDTSQAVLCHFEGHQSMSSKILEKLSGTGFDDGAGLQDRNYIYILRCVCIYMYVCVLCVVGSMYECVSVCAVKSMFVCVCIKRF